MASDVCFEKRIRLDPKTNRKRDEVAVIRDGREVAALPDPSRLDRAMNLPLEEAAWVARNFREIMHRDPTRDEIEFWHALVDYKRAHAQIDSGAA